MRELSLNILDIACNCVTAKASLVEITVDEDTSAHTLSVIIADNGCGMDEETLNKVQDPFYTTRTTRKVGLGIPLFKMSAEMCGGSFKIESEKGVGTTVYADYKTDNIDFVPLGDMVSTVITLATMNKATDVFYRQVSDGKEIIFDTREIKKILGEEVPIDQPEIIQWMRGYLEELIESLNGGVS